MPKKSIKKFTCELCDKKFSTKRSLGAHLVHCRPKEETAAMNPESETNDSAPTVQDTQPKSSEKTEPKSPKGANSWDRDDWNHERFTPSNLLKVELLDPLLGHRWVRDDSRSKVRARLQEGWAFAEKKHVKNFNELPIQLGSQIDSHIRVRELVLMIWPKTKISARNQYYKSHIKEPRSFKKKFEDDMARDGVRTLTEKEILALHPVKPEEVNNEQN